MTKQTIFSIIIVILAIAGAVWLTVWSKKHVPVTPTPEPIATSNESKYLVTKEPQMISVAEDSYLFGIGGTYPQFAQADASFNKKIADTITGGVADFKTSVNADYQAKLETGGDAFQKEFAEGGMYTYEVKTEVVQSNDDFISLNIRIAGYSGGAHGFHNIITFNYNVKDKKEVELQGFVAGDADIFQILSVESRKQLEAKFNAEGTLDANLKAMIADGTDPKKPENFQTFTFVSKNSGLSADITIYYSEYQVAPYVFGEQQVMIPISM